MSDDHFVEELLCTPRTANSLKAASRFFLKRARGSFGQEHFAIFLGAAGSGYFDCPAIGTRSDEFGVI
jgi:hypothetical protein